MKKLLFSLMLTLGITTTLSFAAANAGIEQTVKSGETVYLDGTESTAEHTDSKLKFRWKQLHKCTSPIVEIANARSATATFIAPDVEEATELIFKLKTKEFYDCHENHRHFRHKHLKKFQHCKRPKKHRRHFRCKRFISTDKVSIFVMPADTNNTDNNDTNTNTGITLSGTITDTNGTAIANATVIVESIVVTTDANGEYTFNNITSSQRVSIDVTHPDYLSNSRIVEVTDENISLDIMLGHPKANTTFDAMTGTTLTDGNGASVILPKNGYIDENGDPYTGMVTVKMSYYAITTQSGRATFPGTFEGMDKNGTTFPIQSYGFMNVELSDSNGNSLNLNGNATASLIFPEDKSLYMPSTIPLWYYDKVQGYWVQEGEAVRQSNNTYVGVVKHFTSWNLDAKGPRASFKGCVEDANGTRIPNALVQFRSINWDSYTKPTDSNGTISVYNVLANTDLTFSAYAAIDSTYYYGEKLIYLNEGTNTVDNTCVVLQPQTSLPGTITVTGTLVTSNWVNDMDVVYTPLANQTFHIFTTQYPYQTVATGTTANDGSFSITFDTIDALEYGVGINRPSEKFMLQNNKTIYNLGTVEDYIGGDL